MPLPRDFFSIFELKKGELRCIRGAIFAVYSLNTVDWAEAYLHTKWHVDPCSHLAATDMGRKYLGLCPFRGAGSPSNTVARAEAYTCMPSFILIRPSVWPQYTNVTDTTDRTDRHTAVAQGEPFHKRSPKNDTLCNHTRQN